MIEFLVAMQTAAVRRARAFGRKDEGATAVEYGLMVALIAGVIIIAVTALGNNVSDSFQETCTAVGNTVAQPADCDGP